MYELNDSIEWNKTILFRVGKLMQCNIIASSAYVEWRDGLTEQQKEFLTVETVCNFYMLFLGFWRNEFSYIVSQVSLSRFNTMDMPSRHIMYVTLRRKDNSKIGIITLKIPMYLLIKNIHMGITVLNNQYKTTMENSLDDSILIQRYIESYINNFLVNYPKS